METIGLVPGSFKPYHAGHDGLVAIASRENDQVKLFVSLSDRVKPGEFPLYGDRMREVWQKYIEPGIETTYGNVEVIYVREGETPVGLVYNELRSNDNRVDVSYNIYSDVEDIKKYTDRSLTREAPKLFGAGMVNKRGVDRSETVNVSGTAMRNLLATGQTDKFATLLPRSVRRYAQEIIDILKGPDVTAEALIRNYVREIIKLDRNTGMQTWVCPEKSS